MRTPKFFGALANFCKISFLIRALFLWEKVMTEEKPGGKKKKKMMKIVAANVIASRPPERWSMINLNGNRSFQY